MEHTNRLFITLKNQTAPNYLHIDVRYGPHPPTDWLLVQVANSQSHFIFHSFIRCADGTQYQHYVCPSALLHSALTTVVVYGMNVCDPYNRHVFNVRTGSKGMVDIKGGTNVNSYLTLDLQAHETYVDLAMQDSRQSAYPVDVSSTAPHRYTLKGLHHENVNNDSFIIILHQIHPPETYVMVHSSHRTEYEMPVWLHPATEYKLQLFNVQRGLYVDSIYLGMSHSTTISILTYMTQTEVVELFMKAVNYVSSYGPHFQMITHFYRNKSKHYYDDILINHGGVMRKYIKNWGGEQASSLNRQIYGLFFSAKLDPSTRRPPASSYYGAVRLHVPTHVLMNHNTNMYFADFYCHTRNHKVQLVLVVKGSQTDQYCHERLVLVNPTSNPFLVHDEFCRALVTMNITVELFYTEDVPIQSLMWLNPGSVFFTQTKQIGNALSMVNGIPKNKHCQICNLDCVLQARNSNCTGEASLMGH